MTTTNHDRQPSGAKRSGIIGARPCTVFLASVLVVVAGCGLLSTQEHVDFRFDNRTESVLCYSPSTESAVAARCLQEVEPQAVTKWSPGCGYGSRDFTRSDPITVILTVKESGQRIYNRAAPCQVWRDSDRIFVIEQDGDGFVVTDSLP